MNEKEIVAQRLEEADLPVKRFVDVVSGEKKCIDHTNKHPNQVEGNYGVYGGECLLLIDDDSYNGEDLPETIHELPPTFSVSTPNGGRHLYYTVDEDLEKNQIFEWGEFRYNNQYVVGPGSKINDGQYEIFDNRPIADISLIEVLPLISEEKSDSGQEPPDICDDVEERLEHAFRVDNKLRKLYNGNYTAAGYGEDDRSLAEYVLAGKLAFWFQGDKDTVRDLMNDANLKKWEERDEKGDPYRESVLKAVDEQDKYYTPNDDKEKSIA